MQLKSKKGKQKKVNVSNDYDDFLQKVQSQDPEKLEESDDSYLNLEDPDDYQ